jgi:hypothetical protein
VAGDEIRMLTSANTKWYQKAGAAAIIASSFISGGSIASKVVKASYKFTAKAVKTYRWSTREDKREVRCTARASRGARERVKER